MPPFSFLLMTRQQRIAEIMAKYRHLSQDECINKTWGELIGGPDQTTKDALKTIYKQFNSIDGPFGLKLTKRNGYQI